MRLNIYVLSMLLMVAAFPARATHPSAPYRPDPALYEQVLVPIFTGAVSSGVHGSQWTETVTVHNGAEEPLKFEERTFECRDCPPEGIRPGATAQLRRRDEAFSSSYPPVMLYVPRSVADAVTISERVHELSRASLTWGTEIPVVREGDWRVGVPINLLDVPLGDPAFRTMLRIYFAPSTACYDECSLPVLVRVFEQSGSLADADRLVAETTAFTGFFHGSSGYHPAYIQVSDLASRIQDAKPAARYRIQVVSERKDVQYWAFAAIANNATQHLTVSVPRGATTASTLSQIGAGWWTGNGTISVTDDKLFVWLGCAHARFARPVVYPDGTLFAAGVHVDPDRPGPAPPTPDMGPPVYLAGTLRGDRLLLTLFPGPASSFSGRDRLTYDVSFDGPQPRTPPPQPCP